jgi:hypothetical protein
MNTQEAAARVRAYLDACPNQKSFGRLMPYELPKGAPDDLTRDDLIAVLDQLDSARHRHRAYPDASNPHAYCLNCLTGRKEPGSNFPEYHPWPCPEAVDLGMGKEATE